MGTKESLRLEMIQDFLDIVRSFREQDGQDGSTTPIAVADAAATFADATITCVFPDRT